MGNEVYADLLFLVNFSMDFLCFYLCARLLRRPMSLWRGMLASALGGVYAIAVLFLTVGKVPAFLLDALVCFALCAVAMMGKRERFRSLARLTALYLLISVLLGGVMTALYAQLNRIPGLTDRIEADGISTWLFFGMSVVSAVLTALWGRCFKRSTRKVAMRVTVEMGGRQAVLDGMCDSGNLLRDPISGKCVIPVEISRLEGVFPPALLRAAASTSVSEQVAKLSGEYAKKVRLIPARTATGECMMLAVNPDCVYIQEQGEEEAHEVSALIAPTKLTSKQDGIAALVPSEWMI
jgi:stage II sporulation protein GA (sporulation sigma-E factor processing peptidase)